MNWFSPVSPSTMSMVLGQVSQDPRFNSYKAILFHDLQALRHRIQIVHEAFSIFPKTPLHTVAIKANPVVAILQKTVEAGAGLEAASLEEVHLALSAGCPAEKVIFDSPAKSQDEIEQALRWGINLNADNAEELRRIDLCWDSTGSSPWIGLRVNPEVSAGTIAATSVATKSSKFGTPISAGLDFFVSHFQRYPWLTGLHVHVGSQGCSLELLVEGVKRIMQLRQEIHDQLGRNQIQRIDIGGGLPWNYHPQDQSPSPTDYVKRLQQEVPELFQEDIQVITEFGRAVHAGCGWAASRVEYFKSTTAEPMAVIHLGADFMLRPVYHPNSWHHELSLFDEHGEPKQGESQPTSVAGPLCFAGDVLMRERPLPPVTVGDWLVLHDVGAYTLSMWSRHCSRAIPPVVGYQGAGDLDLLLAGETLEDVSSFWSRGISRRIP